MVGDCQPVELLGANNDHRRHHDDDDGLFWNVRVGLERHNERVGSVERCVCNRDHDHHDHHDDDIGWDDDYDHEPVYLLPHDHDHDDGRREHHDDHNHKSLSVSQASVLRNRSRGQSCHSVFGRNEYRDCLHHDHNRHYNDNDKCM